MNIQTSIQDEARASIDWKELRNRSIRPGGFGQDRQELWPKLLLASTPQDAHEHSEATLVEDNTSSVRSEPHRDERQIGLDTDRSFVLYPDNMRRRTDRQTQLNQLIVSVFRKRQHLHYFQGYHDIVSVLFLTLPPEIQFVCVEKMSLQRLRDAMGTGLEPVIGLLRVLKRLLHVADPGLSELLTRTAPLPYFALSNLLTLMSHDVPTLPLIQHIFDYLICRHPIAIVYLEAAIILSRRDEIRQLEEAGEEGVIYSVLSSLPDLYEEDVQAIPLQESSPEDIPKHEFDIPDDGPVIVDTITPAEATPSEIDQSEGETHVGSEMSDDSISTAFTEDDHSTIVGDEADIYTPPSKSEPIPASPSPPSTSESLSETSQMQEEPTACSTQPSSPRPREPSPSLSRTSSTFSLTPPPPRISLTSLLLRADDLYSQFPPSHPAVDLSSTMGPQSVMRNWAEDPAELPDDDDAELMVNKPELIVFPEPILDEETTSEDDSADEHKGEKRRERAKAKRPRRKLHKPHQLTMQRKTMVAGAVLVLGVAMAVYGIQNGGGAAALFRGMNGEGRHGPGRELKRMGGVVGGMLVGVGERVFEGLIHAV